MDGTGLAPARVRTQQPTTSPPSSSGVVAPRWSAGQAPWATSGRVVTPTVGSPNTTPSCSARPARRGWSRPVALTTSTSGAMGRAPHGLLEQRPLPDRKQG